MLTEHRPQREPRSAVFGRESSKGFGLVLSQCNVCGCEVLLEVLNAGGAGNRQSLRRPVELPSQGDLLRARAAARRDRITA